MKGFGVGPRFPEQKPSIAPGPGYYNINISTLNHTGIAPLGNGPILSTTNTPVINQTPSTNRHKRTRTSSITGVSDMLYNNNNSNNNQEKIHNISDCQLRWQSVNARNELLELQIFTLKQ